MPRGEGVYSGTAKDLLRALNHPLRRRILRMLHEVGEARSPVELHKDLGEPLGNTSYHLKVLRDCNAVVETDSRHVRGAVEHFYASVVANSPSICEILDSTAEEDED